MSDDPGGELPLCVTGESQREDRKQRTGREQYGPGTEKKETQLPHCRGKLPCARVVRRSAVEVEAKGASADKEVRVLVADAIETQHVDERVRVVRQERPQDVCLLADQPFGLHETHNAR